MDELLSDFITETSESLAELDRALLQLERSPDDGATLSTIFRLVHTIKGTCGFLGLPRLEAVSHAAEDVLGRLRDRTLLATPALISLIFSGVDQIKAIIATIAATGAEPQGNDAALITALQSLAAAAPSSIDAGPLANEASSAAAHMAEAGGQTIRVSVAVLEDLMTLVSELVLTRNQLLQLARSQNDPRYTAPLQRLSHLTSDLQEGVMRTRMQPVGRAWNKLPRLVRDLAHDLNKQINLQMYGEDTELDRQVLEVIRDPLTHMVRNCADHGLELPAVRRQAGKPECGTIQLNAFHQGGHIIIEVSDDGAGLAVDTIRARVLSQGLATEAELASMTVRQIQSFIFQPGFSTAASVTSISGRGVGLDVVRTNIQRIGGSVEMQSAPGRGTNFTIKIPLTLAIISALIVEAKGQRFALPQTAVVELVRTQHSNGRTATSPDGASPSPFIETIDGTPVLRLRERLLPLIRLSDVLQLTNEPADPAQAAGHSTVIVTSMGTSTIGIVVDRVFDTEEIVVKPTSPMLRHIPVFSGNTILGDGSIVMILDPNGIARSVGVAAFAERPGRSAAVAQNMLRTEDLSSMLLFRRTAMDPPCAIPLGLVARIEELAPGDIEWSSGRPVMQYRGHLMPLVELDTQRREIGLSTKVEDAAAKAIPVLVFVDRDRSMGLMVHEIVDVVEDTLTVQLSSARPGLLGTAIIAGRVSDVIDAGYWLTQAWQGWFEDGRCRGLEQTRLLVVEDSAFFRHLLLPALSAAGYHVTAVGSALEALNLRETPEQAHFDAIISDIEMPDMDGLSFARRLRSGGLWSDLPIIALTGKVTEDDVASGREAGFTDYVAKFDRETLLRSLRSHLGQQQRMAA